MSVSVVSFITAHAAGAAPIEACGLVVDVAGDATAWPIRNEVTEPGAFSMDPTEVLRVYGDAKRAGGALAGTYHSHPAPNAAGDPSAPDVAFLKAWPQLLHLIVVVDPAAEVYAWTISDAGEVERAEVPEAWT